MDWLLLMFSGCMESVWAVALSRSEGFTKLVPSLIFVIALLASMLGLAVAVRSIPLGSAYAVWVGIGTILTVGYGMLTSQESISLMKIVCLIGIIVCVAGVRLAQHA